MGNTVDKSTEDVHSSEDKRSEAAETSTEAKKDEANDFSVDKQDSPGATIDERSRLQFRQLYRLLTHGGQTDRAVTEMDELLRQTEKGQGFLVETEQSDLNIRSELRIMQQAVLSQDARLPHITCDIYSSLRPTRSKFALWFGITPEHISWAKSQAEVDLDAKRILRLETLCTSSIIEDLRSLATVDASKRTQRKALEALSLLLLHPSNRFPSLLSEKDVRQLTDWIATKTKGKVKASEEDVAIQRLCLKALEAWCLLWADLGEHSTETSSKPLFCRSLAARLVDLLMLSRSSSNFDTETLNVAVRILCLLDAPSMLPAEAIATSDFVSVLIEKFLTVQGNDEPSIRTRFFTALLLLAIARSHRGNLPDISGQLESRLNAFVEQVKAESFPQLLKDDRNKHRDYSIIQRNPDPSAKPIGPDVVAIGALLTCVASFSKFDNFFYESLSHGEINVRKEDEAMGMFLKRFVATNIASTCVSSFAQQASSLLSLPRSIAASFILGLERNDERMLEHIAKILARPDARDFAAQAFDDGASLYFQNSICEFMYPRDDKTKRLAVRSCRYLVAGFVAHDLGKEINSNLYDFFLARVTELEDATSTTRDELWDDLLFLVRMALSLLYRPGDNAMERGPFLPVDADDDDDLDFAKRGERWAESWSLSEARRAFLDRLVSEFFDSTDALSRFAAGRAMIALIRTDESAERALVTNTNLLSRFSESLHMDELLLLRALTGHPGGVSLWISLGPKERIATRALHNRSGGRPIALDFDSNGENNGTTFSGVLLANQVALAPAPIFADSNLSKVSARSPLRFRLGARVVHVENGPGIVVRKDEHERLHVSFDSGLFRRYYPEELAEKARFVGIDDSDDDWIGWTVLFRIGPSSTLLDASELDSNLRVLCQARNGDVHIGVLNKRLGVYEAATKKWHGSAVFLPDKESQTIAVVAKDKRTSFYLVDDALAKVTEFGAVEFCSLEPIFAIGNGLKRANPFGAPILDFMFFPFAFGENELSFRIRAFQNSAEMPRVAIAKFNGGELLKRLQKKLGDESASNTVERRLAACVLQNLALCPLIRLEIIETLGVHLEAFLADMAQEESEVEIAEGEPKSLLDWESRSRLLAALG